MAPLKTKAYLTNVHLCAERGQAQAQLQEAVKGKQGGDRKSDEIKRHGVPNDPTVASYGKPTDRKSRLIRYAQRGGLVPPRSEQ